MIKEYLKQGIKPKKVNKEIEISNILLHENKVLAFVPVEKYDFFLLFNFDVNNLNEVAFVNCYPGFHMKYSVHPDNIDDILSIIKLKPVKIIRKGEIIRKNIIAKTNTIVIIEDNIPDFYDDKLLNILKYFEDNYEDIANIINISNDRDLWIDIYFNSKYTLSDVFFDSNLISKLNKLNFEVTFDIHAQGKNT